MRTLFNDREIWFIIAFNLCLIWGYNQGWLSMDTIVWTYFVQSVFIGLSNSVRMAFLKKFSSDNLLMNGEPVEPTQRTKWTSTLFFTFHFGFFHLMYFIFLAIFSLGNGSKLNFQAVLINTALMFVNALFSTWSRIEEDKESKPSLSSLFFTPYLRVVPMHIFIVLGFSRKNNLLMDLPYIGPVHLFVLFLLLKLLSDVGMHMLVHKSWKVPRPKPLKYI